MELTREQELFNIGAAYNALKNGPRDGTGRAREIVAGKYGCGTKTVERAGYYANGIDAIRTVDTATANAILKGQKWMLQKDVYDIGRESDPETQRKMILALFTKKKSCRRSPVCKQNAMKRVSDVASSLFGEPKESEYTAQELLTDIRMNAEPFIRTLRHIVKHNMKMCAQNRDDVIRTITEDIIYKIEEIEEEIRHG